MAESTTRETVSRTVRFKKEEIREIEKFLKMNPVLDFSSMTREAIQRFIKDPKLNLRPLASGKKEKQKWV